MRIVVTLVDEGGREYSECSTYLAPAEIERLEDWQAVAADAVALTWAKMRAAANKTPLFDVGARVLVEGWRKATVVNRGRRPDGSWFYAVETDRDERLRLRSNVMSYVLEHNLSSQAGGAADAAAKGAA